MSLMKGSKVFVKCLLEMGCERIYGIIGTSVIGFVDALYDVKDKIRYISCRHEQVAASMADVEGRLTQKPGVVLTHSGGGTLNTLISLTNAYKDSSPVIAISGAVKRRLRGCDGMLEIDHLKIFSPICKSVYRVEDVKDIPEIFSSAYNSAMKEAKGPVLIEVPEDIWSETTEMDFGKLKFDVEGAPLISLDDIKEVLEFLKNSSLPLILTGGGVAYSGSSEKLIKFAEKLNVPVITTGNGRGTIPENHPLCLGRVGFGGGNKIADTALQKADLIICIGCGLSDMSTYEFTSVPSGEVVMVNFDKDFDKKGVYVSKHIYGDAQDFLEKMLDCNLPNFNMDKWNKILILEKNTWQQILSASIKKETVPISPARVCDILSKMIKDDTIITVGAGMHLLYPMAFIPCYQPLTFLSAVNFGAMGFGLAAGLAAKLLNPNRQVISILGDGDFSMTMQDLETAKRENINLKIIVINDNSYRVLTMRQKLQLQGRVYGSLHKNPDFVKLAESFGIKGIRIERIEEIEEKLKEFLENEDLVLLEIVADIDDLAPTNIDAVLKMGQQ